MIYRRKCPYCPTILYYKCKSLFNRAEKIGHGCRACGQKITKVKSGYKTSWNTGLDKTDLRVAHNCRHAFGKNGNISLLNKGKTYEEIYGKEKALQIRTKKYREKNNWVNYNVGSIKIIDEYGKKYGYNFQHAENGGEFSLYTKSGNYYFVDGYDKKKNVVIEYYEKGHKYTIEYDQQRKKEIIQKLKCKFIELKEWEIYETVIIRGARQKQLKIF